jgi:hypothetical protein
MINEKNLHHIKRETQKNYILRVRHSKDSLSWHLEIFMRHIDNNSTMQWAEPTIPG